MRILGDMAGVLVTLGAIGLFAFVLVLVAFDLAPAFFVVLAFEADFDLTFTGFG